MNRLWSEEEIGVFFDSCFSDFDTRSLGLLAAFVYDLGVREKYLRELEWVDFSKDLFSVVISDVSYTLSDNLKAMTQQQKDEWDFQPYVFPYWSNKDWCYKPLYQQLVAYHMKEVRDRTGLPKELNLKTLRLTSLEKGK